MPERLQSIIQVRGGYLKVFSITDNLNVSDDDVLLVIFINSCHKSKGLRKEGNGFIHPFTWLLVGPRNAGEYRINNLIKRRRRGAALNAD